MSCVLGIDFRSACVDLVYLDETTSHAEWQHIQTPAGPQGAQLMRARFPGRRELEDRGVYLVALEQPMGQSRNAIAALYRIQGAILASLGPHSKVWTLTPAEWKQGIGLAGNATKTEVVAWANANENRRGRRVWPVDHFYSSGIAEYGAPWTSDACDALGLAWCAREINNKALQIAEATG